MTYLPAPDSPEKVNHDIVDAMVDLTGYCRVFSAVSFMALTALVALGSYIAFRLLPYGAMIAFLGICSGAILTTFLVKAAAEWREQTLCVRNALERRLGVPEHARHRETYVPDLGELS